MSRAGTPPSPEVDPGREARVALYAERAARGEDLMTGESAHEPAHERACVQCGDAIPASRRSTSIYCSYGCNDHARRVRQRAAPAPARVAAPKPQPAAAPEPAPTPAPAPTGKRVTCSECGVVFVRASGKGVRFTCGPECARARYNRARSERRRASRAPMEPASAANSGSRAQAPSERQERAAQTAPQRDGGFAGAMRRAVRAEAREQAAGSPLLRALAAGLRAAADVLDESLGGGA